MKQRSNQYDSAVQRISDFSFRLILNVVFMSSVVLSMLMPQPSPAAESARVKQVVVLYSEDKAHPAHEMTDEGIREVLGSSQDFQLQIYNEYLDASRFGDASHSRFTADYLRRKYSQVKIDVVIAVYTYALDFMLRERHELFRTSPIVACVIGRRSAEKLEGTSSRAFVTGTIAGDSITGIIDGALRLRPETKRIALVAGTSPDDIASEQVFRNGLRAYSGQIDLIDLTKLSMDETVSRVASLPTDTLVFYSTMFRDGTGKSFAPREALSRISRASTVPVFALYETALGFGIVGGPLVSFKKHGEEAASMALRILRGESPASIPFGGEKAYVDAYDWRELKRWGIKEAILPPGSVVKYKQFSAWELYGWYFIGAILFIILQSSIVAVLVVLVRKQKRTEGQLREAEERYRDLYEHAPAAYFTVSTVDGTILQCNATTAALSGYDKESLLKMTVCDLYEQPRQAGQPEDVLKLFQNGETPHDIELRMKRKEGTVLWVSLSIDPVKDVHGNILQCRSVAVDIDDKKRAQGEVIRARAELARVERASRLGELVASLAHELNQPLAAMLSTAQAGLRFLQSASPDLDLIRTILHNIVEDDQRAAGVIKSLRSMVRREASEKEPLNVNDVVNDMLTLFRSEAVIRVVEIITDLADSLPLINADRVQLQQVLLNLVMNAAEAMLQSPPERKKIILKTGWTDHGVQVSVKDYGPGIDPAQLNAIWQPYFTTKRTGLGMGLSVTRSIITAHGGSIRAENNPEGGATFSFEIPFISNR